MTVIAMLVIGGVRSLSGAVVGTVCLSALNQVTSQIENGLTVGPITVTGPVGLEQIVLGLAMLPVLLWRRDGIVGSRELELPARAWVRTLADTRRRQVPGEQPTGSPSAPIR